MGKQLKVHKVNDIPATLEADSLYLHKDSEGFLLVSQTDKQGVISFTTMSTENVYSLIDQKLADSPVVSGSRTLSLGQTSTYTITNYNVNTEYTATAIAGDVYIEEDTITYRAPSSGKMAGFRVNTTVIDIALSNPSFINKPTITKPVNNSTEISQNYLIESSAFAATGETDTHLTSDWQISANPLFSSLLLFTNNNAGAKVAWNATLLPVNTTLYVRVRHNGENLGLSDWSDSCTFTTKATYVEQPSITSLTNGQTNVNDDITLTASSFNVIAGAGSHYSSDWQVATDSGFSTVVHSATDDQVNLSSFNVNNLTVNSTFYTRVRYKSSEGSYSDWSDSVQFVTKTTYDPKPVKPSITSPTNGLTNLGPNLTITSSALSVITGTETHDFTDWQIATDAGFTSIVESSLADTTNKTTWNVTGLPVNTTLYIRARYTGLITAASDWSNTITIQTKQSYSTAPNVPSIIDPTAGAANIPSSYAFMCSNFSVSSGIDSHESSSWEIATDVGFSDIIYSSNLNVVDKTTWTQDQLPVNTTLYIRVKHTGVYTNESSWSTPVSFTTKSTFISTPVITSPSDGAIDQEDVVSITSNAFASTFTGDSHTNSDWQLSTEIGFGSIITESLNDAVNKTTWSVSGLDENTTYYLRTRRRSTSGGVSSWSATSSFTTYIRYINSPSITAPGNGTTNHGPTVTYTASSLDSNIAGQSHTSTDWQVATDSGFTTIVASSLDDLVNKTEWASSYVLNADTIYYARARYTSSDGYVSNWSTSVSFTTKDTYVTTPSVTSPSASATNILSTHQFTSSAFSSSVGGEAHASSDWEIATDVAFTNVIKTISNSVSDKVTWTPDQLPVNTTLYVRVRHDGDFSNSSEWSTPISFTTKSTYVTTPLVTDPVDGATNQSNSVTITSNTFASGYTGDTHTSSDWQLATDSSFTNVVSQSLDDAVNKTTWSVSGLLEGTTYHLSTRRRSTNGGVSAWSATASFTTYAKYINAPSITSPSNGATALGPNVSFTSNAFSSNAAGQSHVSSDWQVATDAGFTNIVKSTIGDAANKLSWSTGELAVNTVHYVRVRYTSTNGYVSNWSSTISFTTKPTYIAAPSITAPGNGTIDLGASVNFTSSAFSSSFTGETHVASTWQIATDAGFTNIISSISDNTSNKTTWSTSLLSINTTYYIRVRYFGTTNVYSAWSTASSFTTSSTFITTPAITAPANWATNQSSTYNITSSAFASSYTGDVHTETDWQIATDTGFVGIVSQSLNDAVNKTSWTVSGLIEGTNYVIRTRQRSSNGGVSAWSVNSFAATYAKYINAPSITAPTNGATNQGPYTAFTASAFSSNIAGQTHASSDWQVATDSGFTTVVKSTTNDVSNKVAWTITDGLPSNATYYARVRYKSDGGYISNWSTTVILSTKPYYVATPSITSPTEAATNLGPTVTVTTGAFASDVSGETHTSTDWQVATDSGFTSVFAQSINDTTNKVSWTTPALTANTTYYLRARYKGSSSL